MENINLLVLGKSGAGKSSLLNYVLGKKVFSVGAGNPVTPRSNGDSTGFFSHPPVAMNGIRLTVHDSWGLEADKAQDWSDLVRAELNRREKRDDMRTWFHAIVYCLSAKGARIEPFEVDVCDQLVAAGHHVLIVLTKADSASSDELKGMRAELAARLPGLAVVTTSSERKVLRSGAVVEPSGLDDLRRALLDNLEQNMRMKMNRKTVQQFGNYLSGWRQRVLEDYDANAGMFSSTSKILERISGEAENRYAACWERLSTWRMRLVDQFQALHGPFRAAFVGGPGESCVEPSGVPVVRDAIVWKAEDHVASFVMLNIPGLNLLYLLLSTSLHRENLEKQLNQLSTESMQKLAADLDSALQSAA